MAGVSDSVITWGAGKLSNEPERGNKLKKKKQHGRNAGLDFLAVQGSEA